MDNTDIDSALTRFHAGDWSGALLELRQVGTLDGEAAAACALCEAMASLPLEPALCDPAMLAASEALLDQTQIVSWPDVKVARTWTTLLRQYLQQPNQVPDALEQLVEDCHSSLWTSGWLLAPRALSYFDQRGLLRRWCTDNSTFAAGAPVEKRLMWVEAGLECSLLDAAAPLEQLEWSQCPPQTLPAMRLWAAWLRAEFAGWSTGKPDSAFEEMRMLIASLSPPDDIFMRREWERITQRISVLGARLACQKEEADDGLAAMPDTWDMQYARGLVAWAAGEFTLARDHFEASQQANPFQERVAFEAAVLADHALTEPVPAVPDMRAMAALLHFRAGNLPLAETLLDSFEDTVAPFSLRLIDPVGYHQRIRRGWELSAHLAEAHQQWHLALARWDIARQGHTRNLTYRAHRLYLMGRLLDEQPTTEDPDLLALSDNFQRELGLLSVRKLPPDAQFYRGLASGRDMPHLAAQDWYSLSENLEWCTEAGRQGINPLLVLADHLRDAGMWDQACHLYAAAPANLLPSALARILTTEVLDAKEILATLENVENYSGGDRHMWGFAHSLLLGMQNPPASASSQVEISGLRDELAALSQCLSTFTTGADDSKLRAVLQEARPLLPPVLCLGLSMLIKDLDTITLDDFQTAYSRSHIAPPIDGGWIIGQQVRKLCLGGDYEAAQSWIDVGQDLSLPSMDVWLVYLKLARSLTLARAGRFDDAQREILNGA
jgi:hypothetical protein